MKYHQRHTIFSVVIVGLLFALVIGHRVFVDQPEPAPQSTPSVIGLSLPSEVLVTPLHGGDPRPLADEILGVTVINYFGSWCAPCRAENPVLLQLRAEGVRLIGVAVRDEPAATQGFLDQHGDPFFRVLNDPQGETMQAMNLGADVPQTLVISNTGEVLYRRSGALLGADGQAALEEIRELAGPR